MQHRETGSVSETDFISFTIFLQLGSEHCYDSTSLGKAQTRIVSGTKSDQGVPG